MNTYLFGAGASHSYDLSPTGVRPPLAKGFFQAYNDLDISGDRYVLVGWIVNYGRDTRGLSPWRFNEWDANVEEFLTEIDEQIGSPQRAKELSSAWVSEVAGAYNQMLFLFASVLNEIQNGPPCSNYSALVNRLSRDDVLVTFNWDCLLDTVLWETGEWHPVDGYGLRFEGLFDDSWQCPVGLAPSKYRLLKLHGSTNWLMPYMTLNPQTRVRTFTNPAVDLATRPMFCFIRASEPYETYRQRTQPGYAPFSYYYYPPDIPIVAGERPGWETIAILSAFDLPDHGDVVLGGYPYSSMPLLIPPVRKKEYGLLGNVLDGVWGQAHAAIVACDRLTIIGYSFPATDFRAWELLESSCQLRTRQLPIILVGPHAQDLGRRVEERLGDKADVEPIPCTFDQFAKAHLL